MKDYMFLFDKQEQLKRIIDSHEFYDDELKRTVRGEKVLTFKVKDVLEIQNGDKIGLFNEDGKFDLFIVDQLEVETYYSTNTKVVCLHDFFSIQSEKAITHYYKEEVSLREAITEMLKSTSYVIGECVERALKPVGPYLFKNPLWCIRDIIAIFGVEIDYSIELNETRTGISRKVLNVVNALGEDTGIRCSTDLNVSKIKRIEKEKFYTVMYGCGAEYQKDYVKYKYTFNDISWNKPDKPVNKPLGQEYVEDVEAIAKYGKIIGIYEDGRVKDPELLLKKTWEALQKNKEPIISYEVNIEELRIEEGYEHLNFKLGDIIIIQNTIDGSRARFRIIEDYKGIRNNSKRKIVVGEQLRGLVSSGGDVNNGGNIIPPGGDVPSIPELDDITPDTLPSIPIVNAKGIWATVDLTWTYENKMYYNYEVYASQIKDFEPTIFNMIFSGQASAYLHEVNPNETWYYKVRAINNHGSTTNFSEQVEATTAKLTDGTRYFENAAIKDALIGELKADRAWVGMFQGHTIDARNLSVTDGNGKRTLDIDSFGRVNLDVTSLKINSSSVDTSQQVTDKVSSGINTSKSYTNAQISVVNNEIKMKVSKDDLLSEINIKSNGIDINSDDVSVRGVFSTYNRNAPDSRYMTVADGFWHLYKNTNANKPSMSAGYWGQNGTVPYLSIGRDDAWNTSDSGMLYMTANEDDYSEDYRLEYSRLSRDGLNTVMRSNLHFKTDGSMNYNSFFDNKTLANTYAHNFDGGIQTVADIKCRDVRVDNIIGKNVAVGMWGQGNYGGVAMNSSIGYFMPLYDNMLSCGHPGFRWSTIHLMNSPTVTSDARCKENIKYTKDATTETTYSDMYNFVKDIELAQYDYKVANEDRVGIEHSLGFIAQDLLNDKVGELIINRDVGEHLSYNLTTYINVLAGALKEAIREVDILKVEVSNLKGSV